MTSIIVAHLLSTPTVERVIMNIIITNVFNKGYIMLISYYFIKILSYFILKK